MSAPLAIPCADSAPAAPLHDSPSRLTTLFDRTPDIAITDRRLRHCDKTVLSSLGHFAMHSHPRVMATQREVAAHSCMTAKWLRNCYQRLESTGYIARERNHRTHVPAEITLLYDFPDRAPNRNDPSARGQLTTAPNGNCRPPKNAPNGNCRPPNRPTPSLCRDLEKNKEREESPLPLNFSNLPKELQPPPRAMRQIARIARDEAFLARLNAGLEPLIDNPYHPEETHS